MKASGAGQRLLVPPSAPVPAGKHKRGRYLLVSWCWWLKPFELRAPSRNSALREEHPSPGDAPEGKWGDPSREQEETGWDVLGLALGGRGSQRARPWALPSSPAAFSPQKDFVVS